MEQHWNMEAVFPSPGSDELKAAAAAARERIRDLGARIAATGPSDLGKGGFERILHGYEAAMDDCSTIGAYAGAVLSVDTSSKEALRAVNKAEELGVDFDNLQVRFGKLVLDNLGSILPLAGKGGPLEEYSYVLEETARSARHMMSPDLEDLASDLNRSGCEAFSRLQDSVASVASGILDGRRRTATELRTMASDPDRKVRKAAYDAELGAWRENQTAFAAALNGVKGTCLSLEKRRGWSSPLERSVFLSRIDMDVLDALIGSIERNLPVFRRYLAAKARALGLKRLSYWDILAPIGKAARRWTYEEARDFIVARYSDFNPAQGRFVANAFDERWIDPFPRAGKVPGAYDEYIPNIRQSRIMANFGGDYDGVFTLAHELGHAWHDHVVSPLGALLREYPMTLAETASIFGEFIVFQGAVEGASGDEEAVLVENFLQSATQTCVDILARFYFEKDLFARRAEGELVPEELCAMMVDAQRRAYGDGLEESSLHPYMWAVKGHYYSEGFSFYNYPYAFGQLFGLGLYNRAGGGGGRPFHEDFDRILSLTGRKGAVEVAASGGCDIRSPRFWQEGLDVIKGYVDRFERLIG